VNLIKGIKFLKTTADRFMGKSAILFLVSILMLTKPLTAQYPALIVSDENREARMAWWHEAKFGMFIHWGLYAIPARGEWVMKKEKFPVAEYGKFAAQFNPVKFNAEAWVKIAKDAGMKYIIITAKHHDGFAMFGSKVSSYNIVDATPFHRDPMKELAAACAKEGIKLGFYYSQSHDWHFPGGGVPGLPWDPAQKGDFDHYLHTLAIPQVKELLSGYNPVVIWFDTPFYMTPAIAREFAQVVRSIHPETIFNSRLLYHGRDVPGLNQAQLDELRDIGVDYLSYGDRHIPDHPAPSWQRNWETCMTLNGAWGFTASDHNWKSPQTVVQMLAEVVSKGGNFPLNFGPTAEGEMPPEAVKIVEQVGAWLRVNGEAIYGAGPSDLIGTGNPAASAAKPRPGMQRKRNRPNPTLTGWPPRAPPTRPLDSRRKSIYTSSNGRQVKWRCQE
jgi:alpha-L-fucosidase